MGTRRIQPNTPQPKLPHTISLSLGKERVDSNLGQNQVQGIESFLAEYYQFREVKKPKMVGIFSRFSVSKVGHRRTQSALDEREVLPPNSEETGSVTISGATSATTHGIEVAVEFKPVEHPIEPFDNDRPVQCPLPEPSILNDGRIWKERASAGARRSDLPVMQEGAAIEPGPTGAKPQPPPHRVILPSISAPEHNILKLLEESGI